MAAPKKVGGVLVEVQMNVARASRDIQTLNAKFDKFSKKTSSSLSRIDKAFSRIGKSVLSMGGVMSGLSAIYLFKNAIRDAAEFEQSLSNIESLLDKGARQSMRRFRDDILSMSAAYGESTDSLSKGLYDIISASVPANKAIKVLGVSVKAAKAGISSTAVAADAITTILNAYAMSAEQAEDVSDVLFSTIKYGKTTMDELAPSMGRVASIAASAGVSFEEVGGAMATLTRVLPIEQATTGLRQLLLMYIKNANGLDANVLKQKGLIGALKQFKGVSATRLAQIFSEVRALTAATTIIGNVELAERDYAAQLDNTGATQGAFTINTDNAAFALDKFSATMKVLGIAAGDILLPGLTKAAEGLTAFLNKIKTLRDQAQGLLPEWAGYGKSNMSMLEEKLQEYERLVSDLAKAVKTKGEDNVVVVPGLSMTLLDEDIERLKNRIRVVKAAIDFLEGKTGVAPLDLTKTPTAKTSDTSAVDPNAWMEKYKNTKFGQGAGHEMFGEFGFGNADDLFSNKLPEWQSMLTDFADTYEEANKAALKFDDSHKGIATTMSGVTDIVGSMEYGISNVFEEILSGTGDVKSAFASMGRSVVGTLSEMIAKLITTIMLTQMLKALSSIFGASSTKAVQADLGPGYDIGNIAQGMNFGHKGGMVTHQGIQRYHTGGMAGLKPDEVPAILQVGERVIPKGSDGTSIPHVEVNVINKGEPARVASQTSRMDQGKLVFDLVLEQVGMDPEKGRSLGNLIPGRR